jgi:hypothetical protein
MPATPTTALVLLSVGMLETLHGAYLLLLPIRALPFNIGRVLAVGAVNSSPAMVPTIASNGSLRLAVGCFLLVAAASGDALSFASCGIFHTCILQPLAATLHGHERLPVRKRLSLSCLEGAALLAALYSDFAQEVTGGREPAQLLALASTAFVAGILLTIIVAVRRARAPSGVEPSLRSAHAQVSPAAVHEGHTGAFVMHEDRYKLSPAAKRLLS